MLASVSAWSRPLLGSRRRPAPPAVSHKDPFAFEVDNPLYRFDFETPVGQLEFEKLVKTEDLDPANRRRLRTGARRASRARLAASIGEGGIEALATLRDVCPDGQMHRVKELVDAFNSVKDELGTVEACLALKRSSATFRSLWILQGRGDFCAQASYLGRALPPATPQMAANALLKHRQDLTTRFVTDAEMLRKVRIHAKSWAKRFCRLSTQVAVPDLPTSSACTESKASEGGLRDYVLRLGIHPDASRLVADAGLNLPDEDLTSLTHEISLSLHGLDISGSHRNQAVALRERGLKVRVITKSPARYHLLGHVVRKRLLNGLRKDPSAKSTLAGFRDSELEQLIGASSECVVSVDFRAATDLLPLDLTSALVDGFSDSGRFIAAELFALRQCTGPQLIEWPSGADVSLRGILMGLPTTWCILSILHGFWWRLAIMTVADRRGVKHSEAFNFNRFVTCGDDGLFCGWREVVDEFDKITARCGAEFSEGKHFVCTGAKLRGVFIERLYTFGARDGLIASVNRQVAIPLKALISPETLSLCGERFVRVHPMFTLLNSLSQLGSQHVGFRRVINRFARRRPELRRFAHGLGLRDGFPLSEGGSGLPRLDMKDVDRFDVDHYRKVGGTPFPSLLRGTVDSVWQLASDIVEGDFHEAGQEVDLWFEPIPTLHLGWYETDLADYKERCIASQYASLVIGMGSGSSSSVRGLSMSKVKLATELYWKSVKRAIWREEKRFFAYPIILSQTRYIAPRFGPECEAAGAAVRSQILQKCFDPVRSTAAAG